MCGIAELSSLCGVQFSSFWMTVFEKRRSFMVLLNHSFTFSCLIKVNTTCNTKLSRHGLNDYTILAGLAQLVEHLTEEWEVVGLISRARSAVLRV